MNSDAEGIYIYFRDERVTLIISECSKLSQKECSGRHKWVGKENH